MTRLGLGAAVALAAIMGACSGSSRTTGQTAEVTGSVVEEQTFTPLAGALVAVGGFTTTTGAAGEFEVAALQPGTHVLAVTAAGYLPYTKTLDLAPGPNPVGQLWLQRGDGDGDGGVPPGDGGPHTDGPVDAPPPGDAPDPGDAAQSDAPPPADAGPDAPPACDAGERRCNGVCAVCPSGATATTCAGAACTATACDVGYALCGADCCGWTTSYLDTVGSGEWAAIRVDAQNRAHIVFANDQDSTVAYARRDGATFSFETVATGRGRSLALTLDASGAPVVAFVSAADNKLYLARPAGGGTWQRTELATSAADTAVGITPAGVVHVAFRDPAALALKHVYGASAPYTTETLDGSGEPGWYVSLAVAADGTVHLAHWAYTAQQMRYLRSGTTWLRETVVDDGFSQGAVNISLALDPSGAPRLAYVDPAHAYGLAVASRAGGTWAATPLTPSTRVEYVALAVDAAGGQHIVYWGFSDTSVWVATNTSGAWGHEMLVDHAMPGILGQAVAVGPNNRPQAVYTTYYTTADLMFARW